MTYLFDNWVGILVAVGSLTRLGFAAGRRNLYLRLRAGGFAEAGSFNKG